MLKQKRAKPEPALIENPQEAASSMPVFTARHRALKAAVWKNDTASGPMYNTTVSRTFKDDSEQWRQSGSFSYDDILIVAELLRTCHGFISREMSKIPKEVKT